MSETPQVHSTNNTEKYKDFQSSLLDNHLSGEEKQNLEKKYSQECSDVHSETQNLCNSLQQEVELYKELKTLSREEIQKLQMFFPIKKDGILGPNTFASILKLPSMIPEFQGLSLISIIEKTEVLYSNYTQLFQQKTRSEVREIQKELQVSADGIFGRGTFYALIPRGDVVQKYFQNLAQTDDTPVTQREKDNSSVTPTQETPDLEAAWTSIKEEELKQGKTFEDIQQEIQNLSKDEVQIFQSIVEAKTDGRFGKNTFKKYQVFIEKNPQHRLSSVSQLIQEQKQIIEKGNIQKLDTLFKNETLTRKDIQDFWNMVDSIPENILGKWLQSIDGSKIAQLNNSGVNRFKRLLDRKFGNAFVSQQEIFQEIQRASQKISQDVESQELQNKLESLSKGLSQHFGMDIQVFFTKLMYKESGGVAGKGAKLFAASGTGSLGVAQATGKYAFNRSDGNNRFNPFHIEQATQGAIIHFLESYNGRTGKNDIAKALDAYNKGPGNSLGNTLSPKTTKKDRYGNPNNYAYLVLNTQI